jgi:hypothetical protein
LPIIPYYYKANCTGYPNLHPTSVRHSYPELSMKPKHCTGGLSPKEMQQLEEETELRLHTCAVCGKRNLYAVKDSSGRWAPEPHDQPLPRVKHGMKSRQT